MASLSILYQDNHLLVINKPAGIATMGVKAGERSLVVQAKQYLKRRYRKPGNVYLGVVSRLDLPVSGVVVFARTSKAAARLSEQFREGDVKKNYLAIVENQPDHDDGAWVDWLVRDEPSRRMQVHSRKVPNSQQAELRYTILKRHRKTTLVRVQPLTGRRHQLRAQLAAHGCPIVGDKRYGAVMPFPMGIALHAESIKLRHPTLQKVMEFKAPVPEAW